MPRSAFLGCTSVCGIAQPSLISFRTPPTNLGLKRNELRNEVTRLFSSRFVAQSLFPCFPPEPSQANEKSTRIDRKPACVFISLYSYCTVVLCEWEPHSLLCRSSQNTMRINLHTKADDANNMAQRPAASSSCLYCLLKYNQINIDDKNI